MKPGLVHNASPSLPPQRQLKAFLMLTREGKGGSPFFCSGADVLIREKRHTLDDIIAVKNFTTVSHTHSFLYCLGLVLLLITGENHVIWAII